MQATFNFTRLGMLIKKQWAEHARLYTLTMGAIAGLMAIALFVWQLTDHPPVIATYIILLVSMFLGGAIFSSMTFADLSQRTTGIYFLSVPATHGEKLVCGILYSQVFFNAVVLALFFILQPIAVSMAKYPDFMQFRSAYAHTEFATLVWNIITAYLAMQALFILGSVYFQRFSFVKTVVATVLTALVFGAFMNWVIQPILPHGMSLNSFSKFGVVIHGQERTYTLPAWSSVGIRYAFQYIWVPVFWTATYFRLKEKEL